MFTERSTDLQGTFMWPTQRIPLFLGANTTPTAPGDRKRQNRWCKTFAALLATLCVGAGTSQADAQLSMLHASGLNIVNANNTVVPLRGVNFGGLFVMEQWMTPLDSGFTPNDTYGVMKTLDSRFGVATEQSLINTFQDSWITDTDLDNVKNAGFNVVRVPVWWGQFYSLYDQTPAGWRSDAFRKLDMIVKSASTRGIYVVIDMHGVVGSQTGSDDTGQQNTNQYWTNSTFQSQTAYMWWQIANHYNGNTTVAGYDLLNEPNGAPTDAAVISATASLYNSVRNADHDHMIFIEGAFDQWNWYMLPDPSSQGWTNVVYSMHSYAWGNPPTASASDAEADKQVSDFKVHSYYNVPGFIGEFTVFDVGASAWQYVINDYNNAGLSWALWSYKSRAGGAWGYYNLKNNPPIPNVYNDSSSTIASDWQQWTTPAAFQLNGALGGINGGGVNTGSGGGGGGGTTPPPPGGISTTAWYNVVNQTSGKCLDAAGWGTSNGTTIQQWACGSQQYNQEWQFQSQGNNIYTIVSRNAPGQVLDVTDRGTADLSKIQTWTYGGGSNQQWTPVANGSFFVIKSVASGRCLDVSQSSTNNGVQMQIFDCNNTGAQNWTLTTQP